MASDKYLDYAGLTYYKSLEDAIYGSTLSISSRTISLKSKDGTTLASVTVPFVFLSDDNQSRAAFFVEKPHFV